MILPRKQLSISESFLDLVDFFTAIRYADDGRWIVGIL